MYIRYTGMPRGVLRKGFSGGYYESNHTIKGKFYDLTITTIYKPRTKKLTIFVSSSQNTKRECIYNSLMRKANQYMRDELIWRCLYAFVVALDKGFYPGIAKKISPIPSYGGWTLEKVFASITTNWPTITLATVQLRNEIEAAISTEQWNKRQLSKKKPKQINRIQTEGAEYVRGRFGIAQSYCVFEWWVKNDEHYKQLRKASTTH